MFFCDCLLLVENLMMSRLRDYRIITFLAHQEINVVREVKGLDLTFLFPHSAVFQQDNLLARLIYNYTYIYMLNI